MSIAKQSTQSYEHLGGINEKVSRYLTGLVEFLNLSNMDFDTPGAVSKRPGQTSFCFAGTSGPVTGLYEFSRLNGYSKIMVAAGENLYSLNKGSTLVPVMTGMTSGQQVDMQTFVDWLWVANGQTFIKYDGVTAFGAGLPKPPVNRTVSFFGSSYALLPEGESTGVFMRGQYAVAYLNTRGHYGPLSDTLPYSSLVGGHSSITVRGLTTPAGYGITAIAIFRNDDPLGFGHSGANFPKDANPFYLIDTISAGSTFYKDVHGNTSFIDSPVAKSTADRFWLFGATTAGGLGMIPRFLELHQNSLFMAGFPQAKSTLWFPEIGDPEDVRPDYNFEFRTNDGDEIRGIKSFDTQLIVAKENSFAKVVGDNPTNYELIEISTEFGCLSNKSMVVANKSLFWLDSKGVVQYTGGAWNIISDRMEPTFRRMNLAAARNNAIAVHYDFRNQIWFGIPVDGSTVNNVTIVYDYKADAWTKFEGFNPSAFLRGEGGLGTKTVFMGNYSGMISYFGASFTNDMGQGITCLAKPGFIQPQGRDAEAMFRRLWLDTDPAAGGTINVDLLADMSDAGVTSMTMSQDAFQSRLEIGVQAKALGLIFSHHSATLPFKVNGWAIAHRWIRNL